MLAREQVQQMVRGWLIDCLNAHPSISRRNLESAVKRLAGQFEAVLRREIGAAEQRGCQNVKGGAQNG